MNECPNCGTQLVREQIAGGVVFGCPKCHGLMAGLGYLRQHLFSQPHLNMIWQQARDTYAITSRKCPHCDKPMKQVLVGGEDEEAVELEVCTSCQQIWFDADELTKLPHRNPPPPEPPPPVFPPETQLRIDKGEIYMPPVEELDYREERSPADGEEPGSVFKTMLGAIGFPVTVDTPRVKKIAWVTYGLIMLLTVILVITYRGLDNYIADWGLIPAQWTRHYGLTLATGFFLHAGIVHLLFNIYFLDLTGEFVEQELGTLKFIFLLALSSLCGDLLHVIFNLKSNVPCVGASGGICGVMAFFAVSFPQARIGSCFRGQWIYLPAPRALLFYIGLELFALTYFDDWKSSGIAVLAHFGGMAPGLAWAIWRRIVPKPGESVAGEEEFDPRREDDRYKF